MKNKLIAVAIFLLMAATFSNTLAQSLYADPAACKAYLAASAQEALATFERLVLEARKATKANSDDNDLRFNQALAEFSLLNATMRTKDRALFNKYIDDAVANVEKIEGQHATEAQALLAGLHGLQMAYDASKGMSLGPKTAALFSKAIKADPNSALIWKLYGNSKLHTPEAYGGDVAEAISAYEKTVKLYESGPQAGKGNWFYLDTMAFLGQAYVRQGETDKALAIYDRALKVEPSFTWVKNSLITAAKKK